MFFIDFVHYKSLSSEHLGPIYIYVGGGAVYTLIFTEILRHFYLIYFQFSLHPLYQRTNLGLLFLWFMVLFLLVSSNSFA